MKKDKMDEYMNKYSLYDNMIKMKELEIEMKNEELSALNRQIRTLNDKMTNYIFYNNWKYMELIDNYEKLKNNYSKGNRSIFSEESTNVNSFRKNTQDN